MPLLPRRLMVSWAALEEVFPAGQERWPFPSLSSDEATCGVLCPVLGSLIQEIHGVTGKSPDKGQ